MLAAIDIETKPKAGCEDIEEAGLVPHLSDITVMGAYCEDGTSIATRSIDEFFKWLAAIPDLSLTFHNGKFDFKHLIGKDARFKIFIDNWTHDSNLMAHIHTKKIPEAWLLEYEAKRKEANKKLKHGFSHRVAGPLSLKTLAPYFLKVEPFWETPEDHNNDEYVLKDCEYTLRLTQYFLKNMTIEEMNFYQTYQLPWTKMLMEMELQGIGFDVDLLYAIKEEQNNKLKNLNEALSIQWDAAIRAYHDLEMSKLGKKYDVMLEAARSKGGKTDPTERYEKLKKAALATKVPQLNFGSPAQLTWLLKDYLGYDIRGWDGEESTDKEVLEKLAQEGRRDVKLLLEYRETSKLVTAFIPTYERLQIDGRIHTNFNPSGARTGRVSCSGPNLQNVPTSIRALFRPVSRINKLITKDYSALEPVLIAYYTQDPLLKQIVNEGKSFHSVNAKAMFKLDCEEHEVAKKYPEERKAAKEAGLSILYGAGAKRLLQSLQKRGFQFTLDECKEMVKSLRAAYSKVWDFKMELDALGERGDTVYNYMGRPIRYYDPTMVYMTFFNKLIQGSGSDILQASLYEIAKVPGIMPKLTVHDEGVFEINTDIISCDEAEKIIDKIMTMWDLGDVKLKTEGGVADVWSK